MKDKKKHLLNKSLINVISITLIIITLANYLSSISKPANQSDGGYTIESYKVILDVGENNKVDVTENITVNWNELNHHGIYRFIPEWLEYTGENNKVIKRKSKVKNLRVEDEEYVLSTELGKKKIRIGSANEYVPLGNKTYIIKYTYDMGEDPYRGYDEFIFHAYGDYWDTSIKNASLEIHMPKNFDESKINFYIDKYRKENVNKYVSYHVTDNVIYANVNLYRLNSSLTVDINLEDKYFKNTGSNYGIIDLILLLGIVALLIYTIISWYKYGKDFAKRVPTVEFYPPEELTSAEIGYIYNMQTTKTLKKSRKLTISLIVSLASKGYIKIDEVNDKKKEIEITNLYREYKHIEKFSNTYPERIIDVEKLKEPDEYLTDTESSMMAYLFLFGNRNLLMENIRKFLEVKTSLEERGYIKIINDITLDTTDKERKKEVRRIINEYNEQGKLKFLELNNLPPLTDLEEIVYDKLFNSGQDKIILSKHTSFYKVFNEVNSKLDNEVKYKIRDKYAEEEYKLSLSRTLLMIALLFASYSLINDLSPKLYFLYKIGLVCIFINFFFTLLMKRKTEYGEEIKARIEGFKNFLVTAEKEDLEAQVEKNPHYFYDILPYTYVLGISKKWIKKFENIKMPEENLGTFNFDSDTSFRLMTSSISFPEPTHNSGGSSSGCSSCGGGCSSCGGGCSSCGGGGSW